MQIIQMVADGVADAFCSSPAIISDQGHASREMGQYIYMRFEKNIHDVHIVILSSNTNNRETLHTFTSSK